MCGLWAGTGFGQRTCNCYYSPLQYRVPVGPSTLVSAILRAGRFYVMWPTARMEGYYFAARHPEN